MISCLVSKMSEKTTKNKKCYDDKYAPQNAEHNCRLYNYEQEHPSTISPVAWRKVINYLLLPVDLFLATHISQFARMHNMMTPNNFGLFQHIGILTIPIIATINLWPLAVNDFLYSTFGIDWIFNDLLTINYVISPKKTSHNIEYNITTIRENENVVYNKQSPIPISEEDDNIDIKDIEDALEEAKDLIEEDLDNQLEGLDNIEDIDF